MAVFADTGWEPQTVYRPGSGAEIAIGISVEKIGRARTAEVAYMRNTFPLFDPGRRRPDCVRYLAAHALADTPRSTCVGLANTPTPAGPTPTELGNTAFIALTGVRLRPREAP